MIPNCIHEDHRPPKFGIELTDYDIAAITPSECEQIRTTVFRHRFAVLRNQHCTPGQLEAFASRIGGTIPHVLARFCIPGHRNLLRITNLYDQEGNPMGVHDGGNYWHSDMSYLPNTGILTGLHSIKTASTGGDTRFLDCVGVTRRLRKPDGGHYWGSIALDALFVRHRFGNREILRDDHANTQRLLDSEREKLAADVVHPLLRPHPYTGEVALYATAATAQAVIGMAPAESSNLLDSLCEFIFSEADSHTHNYQAGDLIIWDNLTTLHAGTPIQPSNRHDDCRLLHRFNVEYGAAEMQNARTHIPEVTIQ